MWTRREHTFYTYPRESLNEFKTSIQFETFSMFLICSVVLKPVVFFSAFSPSISSAASKPLIPSASRVVPCCHCLLTPSLLDLLFICGSASAASFSCSRWRGLSSSFSTGLVLRVPLSPLRNFRAELEGPEWECGLESCLVVASSPHSFLSQRTDSSP